MFIDLFYGLRDEGLPLGMQEWLTFMEALKKGLHGCNLLRFYYLARACLVKSETFSPDPPNQVMWQIGA